jgi:antitoxin PrlF
MRVTVGERGQATIPKEFRDKLGIRPGTVLDYRLQNHMLVISKADESDRVQKIYGCLKKAQLTDAIIEELRGKP